MHVHFQEFFSACISKRGARSHLFPTVVCVQRACSFLTRCEIVKKVNQSWIAILGTHVSFSFLKYLAHNNASSPIFELRIQIETRHVSAFQFSG
jgi:hypothetical protein